MTSFPAEYLEILKLAKGMGADLGQRITLLENDAQGQSSNPVLETNTDLSKKVHHK